MNGTSTVNWDSVSSCPNCGHPVLTGHLAS
jgi:ribosomal protein L32